MIIGNHEVRKKKKKKWENEIGKEEEEERYGDGDEQKLLCAFGF